MMISEISFNDFESPLVLDFEGLSSGFISGTDPFFTNLGIESISVTGGIPAGDLLDGTAVQGNSLASVNGALAIVSVDDPLDNGISSGNPEFTLNFSQPITKFGTTLTDQFGMNFALTFLRNSDVVDEFNFEIFNGDFESATRYIQTSNPFDSVKITHPSGVGGYGVDNITFESFEVLSGQVFNGDFEFGNIGFSSDYSFDNEPPFNGAGFYTVDVDPNLYNSALASFGDHTTGTGNMLIADGSLTSDQVIWQQTISVEPNTEYSFSAWIANAVDIGSIPQLVFNVNGEPIGSPFTPANTPGIWEEFRIDFDPGNKTLATLSIVDLNTALIGNDFALDDISISEKATFNHLIVNTLVDENNGINIGGISLREAIAAINPGGTITFDPNLIGTMTLDASFGQFVIDKPLTIEGLGADVITVSGNNQTRIFFVDDGENSNQIEVLINGLTITEGRSTGDGAGIFNRENLTVTESVITSNESTNVNGGIFNVGNLLLRDSTISDNIGSFGAGLRNQDGTATVLNSTISGNIAANFGGGIDNIRGVLEVVNSTISGNFASQGGGIGNGGGPNQGSELVITNSTITNNTANFGGGIENTATATLSSTIVAGNIADTGSDVRGNFFSSGDNLIGERDESSGFINGVNGDIVGTVASPIDPILDPLQDNGGPTFTHGIGAGSPAINAGNNSLELTTDQRGEARVQRSLPDIGAFESSRLPTSVPISDDITGTADDDRLRGTDNNEQIFGLSGDDRIRGRDGDDILFGGSGNDRMRGDDDNDTLVGGLGDDVLFGNDGSDLFVLVTGEGTDIIRDLKLEEGDRIGLAGGLQFSQLSFEDDQILFGDEILAEVQGFDTSSLTLPDFIIIEIDAVGV